jgi:hypothetical protein
MEARLYEVIRDFERATAKALEAFLARAGLQHPFSRQDAGLPRAGQLRGAPPLRYEFHGAGLRLDIAGEVIDFDFGFDGRTGGFNDWLLRQFAEARPSSYPEYVVDPNRLSRALASAAAAGEIEQPFRNQQDVLWYLRQPDRDPDRAT